MKAIKLSVVLMLLASFCGCGKQAGVFVGKGRYGLEFKQECTFPSSEPILEVFGQSIQIIDTLLLVEHQYANPSHYWDVYGLNSLKHLKSILMRGRGPGEVLFAHYTGQHEKVNGESRMFFLDPNTSRFLKIDLPGSIRSGNDIIEYVSDIDPSKVPYFLIADDTFLYRDYDLDNGVMSLMKSDGSWKNPTVAKEVYRNISNDDFDKFLHSNTICYNKTNNKVCVVPGYIDHIQIIDLDGRDDMVLSTADSDNWPAVRQQQDFMELSIFYGSTRITDDYIFALYYNKKLSELSNGLPKETEIHVFNWNGDAIAKIRLEDHIASFAVDARNKVLYGINNMEQIYAYDIGACLD